MRFSKFTAGLIMCLAFVVVDETRATGLSLGPQVGYYKAKDADEGTFMFGGAARLGLGPALGVEGSVNYREEDYFDGAVTVTSFPVMVTGLFYPLPVLYAAAGAGWYNAEVELKPSGEKTSSDEFGWHFGGGIESPLRNSTLLAADIRYVILEYDFSELPGSDGAESDFFVVTVSILWNFGKDNESGD